MKEYLKELLGGFRIDTTVPNESKYFYHGKHKNDIRYIHGTDMFPDDYRYKMIYDILTELVERDIDNLNDINDKMHKILDNMIPIYNSYRIQWLASNLQRIGYVNDAKDTFGHSDLMTEIAQGYYMESEEIFNRLINILEKSIDIDSNI